MLYIYVFFIAVDVNKNRVFVAASFQRCGPVCARFTCEVTKAIEIVPTRTTDICKIGEALLTKVIPVGDIKF